MYPLTQELISTVTLTYGDRGKIWINSLPEQLSRISIRHRLTLLPPYPNLTYNYVAPAVLEDGTCIVLKLGIPNSELESEIEALKCFDGQGAVRIFWSNSEEGLMLLERLVPGEPLTSLAVGDAAADSIATSIACNVMQAYWHEPGSNCQLRRTESLMAGFSRMKSQFSGDRGPIPAPLVEMAESLWLELERTCKQTVVLHGDLHHDNIVSAARAPWLAIDPKGYVGDPAFDTSALMRNLWLDRCTVADPVGRLSNRIAQMASDLAMDPYRIWGWAMCQAVLSVCWSLEDHDPNWQIGMDTVRWIENCKP